MRTRPQLINLTFPLPLPPLPSPALLVLSRSISQNLHEGFQLGPVLLLEHQSKRQAWRVTRKPALVAAGQAGSFPKELSDLHKVRPERGSQCVA